MLSTVKAIYENGKVKLLEDVKIRDKTEVLITFPNIEFSENFKKILSKIQKSLNKQNISEKNWVSDRSAGRDMAKKWFKEYT